MDNFLEEYKVYMEQNLAWGEMVREFTKLRIYQTVKLLQKIVIWELFKIFNLSKK